MNKYCLTFYNIKNIFQKSVKIRKIVSNRNRKYEKG